MRIRTQFLTAAYLAQQGQRKVVSSQPKDSFIQRFSGQSRNIGTAKNPVYETNGRVGKRKIQSVKSQSGELILDGTEVTGTSKDEVSHLVEADSVVLRGGFKMGHNGKVKANAVTFETVGDAKPYLAREIEGAHKITIVKGEHKLALGEPEELEIRHAQYEAPVAKAKKQLTINHSVVGKTDQVRIDLNAKPASAKLLIRSGSKVNAQAIRIPKQILEIKTSTITGDKSSIQTYGLKATQSTIEASVNDDLEAFVSGVSAVEETPPDQGGPLATVTKPLMEKGGLQTELQGWINKARGLNEPHATVSLMQTTVEGNVRGEIIRAHSGSVIRGVTRVYGDEGMLCANEANLSNIELEAGAHKIYLKNTKANEITAMPPEGCPVKKVDIVLDDTMVKGIDLSGIQEVDAIKIKLINDALIKGPVKIGVHPSKLFIETDGTTSLPETQIHPTRGVIEQWLATEVHRKTSS